MSNRTISFDDGYQIDFEVSQPSGPARPMLHVTGGSPEGDWGWNLDPVEATKLRDFLNRHFPKETP